MYMYTNIMIWYTYQQLISYSKFLLIWLKISPSFSTGFVWFYHGMKRKILHVVYKCHNAIPTIILLFWQTATHLLTFMTPHEFNRYMHQTSSPPPLPPTPTPIPVPPAYTTVYTQALIKWLHTKSVVSAVSDTSSLANGSTAFKWKPCCYWLNGLSQQHAVQFSSVKYSRVHPNSGVACNKQGIAC